MTKYEMLEKQLNTIQTELKKAKKDGSGNIQYAESNFFTSECDNFLYHIKSGHEPWMSFVRIAKSLYGVKSVQSLQIQHACVCKDYINELISIHNKYEKKINAFVKYPNSEGFKKMPYEEIVKRDKEKASND